MKNFSSLKLNSTSHGAPSGFLQAIGGPSNSGAQESEGKESIDSQCPIKTTRRSMGENFTIQIISEIPFENSYGFVETPLVPATHSTDPIFRIPSPATRSISINSNDRS